MQIVYLSNRPEVAMRTLEYVQALMPFLTEAIFICPRAQIGDFRRSARQLMTSAVAEEEILGKRLDTFRATSSHVVKNWLLRSALPTLACLGEEFIMSDDDYRPMQEIPLNLFRKSGRYHAYYNFELSRWRAAETDYDRGQQQTYKALVQRGFPTLSYSSHMPQIIRTSILAEVAETFRSETDSGEEIEEWSLYFNTGQELYPDLFHPPRPFRTLCWPALPTDWEYDIRPGAPCFENYYPELYAPGGLFEGIPERFDAARFIEHAAEKIRRRTAVQAVYESRVAKFLRRLAWALFRLLTPSDTPPEYPATSQQENRWLPRGMRKIAREITRHADDPAWSFPSFMTRYRCRRGSLPPKS